MWRPSAHTLTDLITSSATLSAQTTRTLGADAERWLQTHQIAVLSS